MRVTRGIKGQAKEAAESRMPYKEWMKVMSVTYIRAAIDHADGDKRIAYSRLGLSSDEIRELKRGHKDVIL